ncbi:hypothetical protein [Natrinema salinisoli]|uniref:hypothetical protein n=1 Tax=Natrinema salinisoli TaxID=2878535 RepID=UPI001CF0A340|nr:hypothetical protein [Natrinema salinisoli]
MARETKNTNVLLGTNTVVLAAGFLSLGNISSRAIQAVSEVLLVLVLLTAIGLVSAGLFVQQ